MNRSIVDGKWRQIRGAMREQWGRLTDDDMHILMGRTENLVGMLEERYGYTRAKAEEEVNHFLERYGYRLPSLAWRIRRVSAQHPWLVAGTGFAGIVLVAGVMVFWRMLQPEGLELLRFPEEHEDVSEAAPTA